MSKLLDPNQSRRQSSIVIRDCMMTNTNGAGMTSPGQEGAMISASDQTEIANNCVRFRTAIVLNIDDPPPRRIERQMFSLKELVLEFMNHR